MNKETSLNDQFSVSIEKHTPKLMTCAIHEGFLVLKDSLKNIQTFFLSQISSIKLLTENKMQLQLNMELAKVEISIFTEKNIQQIRQIYKKIISFINKKRKMTINDFNEISAIGTGATGKVILASDKLTNELFAIKIIPKSILRNEKSVSRALFERDALMKTQHPFITQLFRTFQSKNCLYYVLEYVGGGDLFFHLNRGVVFSPWQVKLYACEIVVALKHIHKLGIIYRDLKPENILIGADGHIKLADFGLAKDMQCLRCSTMCGTVEYLSPEMVSGKKYDVKSDWWTFGVVLFRLLTNRLPFVNLNNTAKLFAQIVRGRIRFPPEMDPVTKDLLSSLLVTDPEKRIGDDDIMEHPYFSDIDWNKVTAKGYEPCFIPEMASPDSTENFPTGLGDVNISAFERESSDSSSDSFDGFIENSTEDDGFRVCSAPLIHLNDFSCTNLKDLDTLE